MAKYFLTNRAVEDLSKIWDYTYKAWSENQADKYYQSLIDSCKELSENPKLGKNYDAIAEHILGYRINRHIIFYREIKANTIEVIRILHARMDLKSRIEE